MAAIIHTTEAPTFEALGEAAILTFKSGHEEVRLYLSFHNLCQLIARSHGALDAVSEAARLGEVIPFVREADGKRTARRRQ